MAGEPTGQNPRCLKVAGFEVITCGGVWLITDSAAGCTRRPTCWTNCPKASRRKPRACCTTSGWPTPARPRRRRSICSFEEGPGGAADVLRLPGGTLAAPANDEPDREHVCHGAPADGENERLWIAPGHADDGVPPGAVRPGSLAGAERIRPAGRGDRRHSVRQWTQDGRRLKQDRPQDLTIPRLPARPRLRRDRTPPPPPGSTSSRR